MLGSLMLGQLVLTIYPAILARQTDDIRPGMIASERIEPLKLPVGVRLQDSLTLCVIDSAAPRQLRPALVHPSDSVGSTRFWGYAAAPGVLNESWVKVLGTEYQKAGAPRRLPIEALTRVGDRQGASVFIEPGIDLMALPEIIYFLDPDCNFVPFRSRYWSQH